jgi:hypothetical protein
VRENGKPERGPVDFSCWERRPGGSALMKTDVLVLDMALPARRRRSREKNSFQQDSILIFHFFLTQ